MWILWLVALAPVVASPYLAAAADECSTMFSQSSAQEAGVSHDLTTETGTSRVFRGGGWDNNARDLRSVSRFSIGHVYRLDSVGLRLSRTVR